MVKTKDDWLVERILETPVEIWHKNDKQEFYAVWGTGVYSVKVKRVHTVELSTFKYPSPIGERSQVSLTVEVFWASDPFYKSEFFYGDRLCEKLERYLSQVTVRMEEMRQRKEDHFFSWLRGGRAE